MAVTVAFRPTPPAHVESAARSSVCPWCVAPSLFCLPCHHPGQLEDTAAPLGCRRMLSLLKVYGWYAVHSVFEGLPLVELVTDFLVANPDVEVFVPDKGIWRRLLAIVWDGLIDMSRVRSDGAKYALVCFVQFLFGYLLCAVLRFCLSSCGVGSLRRRTHACSYALVRYADMLYWPAHVPLGLGVPPYPHALRRIGPRMAELGVNDGPRNVVLFISR